MSESNLKEERELYQTFDVMGDSLKKALRRISPHQEYEPPIVDYRRPVSFFLSDEQFELEQEKVFRKLPVVITVSALLNEPGSVMAHDGYGLPLLVTRDKDGKARVFLNACMHKGAKLIEDCEVHKKNLITCPYHSWSFALNGDLKGVPREASFGGLDKSTRGLAELPCEEVGGLIWAILDKNAEPDFSILGSQMRDDMASLDFAESHCYGHKTFNLKANWKLVMEPFLEAYHVKRLHATTVGPMFQDVSGVVDIIDGYHVRQISGRADFEPAMLDATGANLHKTVTMTWELLPSTVLIGSPYYLSVMVVIPIAANRTQVDYYMLTRHAPDNDKAHELYKKSYDMILDVFGNEDFRAAEISQVGLESGALEDTIYCGMEENIPRYYEVLEKHLNA